MELRIIIIVAKNYSATARRIISSHGKIDILDPSRLSQKKLTQIIHRYDGAVIGLKHRFDKAVLSNAKRLKFIATVTTGLDHIDLLEARSRKVEILSLKGERAFLSMITGTAELAFGLMIGLARHIYPAVQSVKRFEWNRENFVGCNLLGKVIGIVGMGRLGTWMARYARAFGMNVIFHDPYVKKSMVPKCQRVSFSQILKKSDFISLHVSLSKQTEFMIDAPALRKMKKTAYLINTARGRVVNERDLLTVLKKGSIAGYAADVLDGEPFSPQKIRRQALARYAKKRNHVLLVPHIGGITLESRQATDIFMAQKIKKYIESNFTKL